MALLTSNAISAFSLRIHFEYWKMVSKYSGLSLWRYVIDGPSLSFTCVSFSLSLQCVSVESNTRDTVSLLTGEGAPELSNAFF
jgi:hypothetical protein